MEGAVWVLFSKISAGMVQTKRVLGQVGFLLGVLRAN